MSTPVTQRDVTVYAKRQAAINRSTAKNKELRARFIDHMNAGNTLPEEGPYVILLSQNGGKELDWKEQYRALFIMAYKKLGIKTATALAAQDIARVEAAAPPKKEVEMLGKKYVGGVKLEVKANPSYRTTRKVA